VGQYSFGGSASKVASKRDERNGTRRDDQRRFQRTMCGYMGLTEYTGSAEVSGWTRPSVRWYTRGLEAGEHGGERPRRQRCPSMYHSDRRHTDTRRHATTASVGQSSRWRWRPTIPHTPDWVSIAAGRRCDSCPTRPDFTAFFKRYGDTYKWV
jgi:hypothetical protein